VMRNEGWQIKWEQHALPGHARSAVMFGWRSALGRGLLLSYSLEEARSYWSITSSWSRCRTRMTAGNAGTTTDRSRGRATTATKARNSGGPLVSTLGS
jgi:hypothetical protein